MRAPTLKTAIVSMALALCVGSVWAPAHADAFKVLDANASIDPFTTISGFEKVDDHSLLLRANGRLYLLGVDAGCIRFAGEPVSVDFVPSGPTLDRFGHVTINGETRCAITSLVRVEREVAAPAAAPATTQGRS